MAEQLLCGLSILCKSRHSAHVLEMPSENKPLSTRKNFNTDFKHHQGIKTAYMESQVHYFTEFCSVSASCKAESRHCMYVAAPTLNIFHTNKRKQSVKVTHFIFTMMWRMPTATQLEHSLTSAGDSATVYRFFMITLHVVSDVLWRGSNKGLFQ